MLNVKLKANPFYPKSETVVRTVGCRSYSIRDLGIDSPVNPVLFMANNGSYAEDLVAI